MEVYDSSGVKVATFGGQKVNLIEDKSRFASVKIGNATKYFSASSSGGTVQTPAVTVMASPFAETSGKITVRTQPFMLNLNVGHSGYAESTYTVTARLVVGSTSVNLLGSSGKTYTKTAAATISEQIKAQTVTFAVSSGSSSITAYIEVTVKPSTGLLSGSDYVTVPAVTATARYGYSSFRAEYGSNGIVISQDSDNYLQAAVNSGGLMDVTSMTGGCQSYPRMLMKCDMPLQGRPSAIHSPYGNQISVFPHNSQLCRTTFQFPHAYFGRFFPGGVVDVSRVVVVVQHMLGQSRSEASSCCSMQDVPARNYFEVLVDSWKNGSTSTFAPCTVLIMLI